MENLFKASEIKMSKAVEIARNDLAATRAGRASPALLDKVRLDYYGVPTSISAVATVNVPSAQLIVIQPWDRNMLGAIEKAIQKSDIGLNPSSDGQVIRLTIPHLTEERRKELVRLVQKRAEEARVAIRNVRRDTQDELKKLEKEKQLSEDDAKRAHARLEKLTQRFISDLDDLARRKEAEVLEV